METTLRLLGLLILLCILFLPATVMSETLIHIDGQPDQIKKMESVFFAHDRHVKRLQAENIDCTSCHVYTDKGFSENFLVSNTIPKKKYKIFMHKNCVNCHRQISGNTGPNIMSCRSCHTETYVR
jgi:hypothetical protein